MKQFLVLLSAVALTVGVLLNVHIIRYDGGVTARMKEKMTFDFTWVDLTDHNVVSRMLLPGPVRKFAAQHDYDNVKKGISGGLDKLQKEINK